MLKSALSRLALSALQYEHQNISVLSGGLVACGAVARTSRDVLDGAVHTIWISVELGRYLRHSAWQFLILYLYCTGSWHIARDCHGCFHGSPSARSDLSILPWCAHYHFLVPASGRERRSARRFCCT